LFDILVSFIVVLTVCGTLEIELYCRCQICDVCTYTV